MNKIAQIVLLNCQCHSKLIIDLTEGFNAITGNNNKGKSTIIRILNWIITNSPRGDWMRKRTKKGKMLTATGKVIFEDGQVVKRIKGKDKNYYVVNGEEYHDFSRTGIPEAVLDAFGLDETLVNAIGITPNIDMQDDQPFLVYDKTTTKAVAINLITGTGDIEDSIKDYNKDRLEHSRNISYNNKVIEETKASAKKYDVLKDIKLKKVEKQAKELRQSYGDLERLQQIKKEHKDCSVTIREYSVISKVYKDILQAEHDVDDLTQLQPTYNTLISLQEKLLRFDGVGAPPDVDFDKIQDKVQVIDKKRSTVLKLEALRCNHGTHKREMVTAEKDMLKSKKKLAGEMCPLCGNKIKRLV